MRLRHVEILLAIMRAGTISRAAELLCISQPAMSKAATSGRGRLTAGETTRTSRSEGGMLISIPLYSRIAHNAFV